MKRILIRETLNKIDQKVKIGGWICTKRDHGKVSFIDLRDRSGLIQIVGYEGLFSDLTQESVVEIEGLVKKRPDNLVNKDIETGTIEIEADKVNLLAKADVLPFDMAKPDLGLQLPTLLDYRALTLRHPKVAKIFKVQEAIMEGFRRASQELGCTEVFVPTISASATEGGAEVFKIKYYDNQAYLIQSPQLYKQILVPVFERVYLVSHAYRSEPSVTTRHLSESIQMDCEFGFVNFNDLLDALEYIGGEILKYVAERNKDILKEFHVEEPKVGMKIPRIKMRDAQKLIKERTGIDHTNELDLDPFDERELSKWALEEFGSDLVTVTHYPTKKRAFYTMPDPNNPEYSLSYDLIYKGLEILSGSQRINNYDQLVKTIKEKGMDPEDFEMYLQAFKYGMPPEGGFSFGLERMTMQILGLGNVREASLFPRDMERVDFLLSRKNEKEE